MIKEETKNSFKNFLNPFYKGVCKMKALRIFMMVALLAMPLFASSAWADFTADTVYTAFARIGATTTNQPILGFTIPKVGDDTLKTVALKSYNERAFSVKLVKLWVETNGTAGWQSGDTHLKTFNTNGMRFETQDTIVIGGLNRIIKAGADTFYITVDAHTDSVNANAYFYHEHGLEVVIEPGYIHLGLSSLQLNTNRVNNSGYVGGVTPYFTAFKLIFDTQGPPFTLDWCFAHDGCKTDTIDQLDTLCIQADTTAFVDEGDAIDGGIEIDLSAFCLASDFELTHNSPVDCFSEGGNDGWDSCFGIPDTRDCPDCIDVDSGYVLYATAKDSAGNETTASLYFDKPIDTCKPNIDSIHFFITYDANDDGIGAIGDSLAIVAWALSNADFEVDSMIANLSAYFPNQPSKRWQKLDDVTNNNRLFRLKFMLEEELVEMEDTTSENRITIWAWDNACNYDTAQQMLNAPIDLQRPSFVECYYFWHWDIDTFDCIGIGDSVLIGANLTGADDLVSVTCDLVEAGIYGASNQTLYDDGAVEHGDATADDAIYNLLWEVGEPPIEDGKDTNNTVPPTEDYNYTVLLRAEDGAGNWDTCRTPRLNRILDSRRPRWTNQEKIYIKQMPDAKLAIFWPTSDVTPANSCNEKDAIFFFVYVDSGLGWETDPIGATFDTEYKSDTNMWVSEVLSDGKYYKFKMKQEDDCGNFSLFSKEMGMAADGTPPHVCIAVPDSGLTFGDDFVIKAVADSVSHDVDSVCLWYRFRPDIEDPLFPPGPWTECRSDPCCCMMNPADGYIFTQTFDCMWGWGYTGWVEVIPVACDLAGNCQDTTMGFDDACLVVDNDVFRPGHFLFYWDTLAPGVMVTEVDSVASPQTACGYDVWRDRMNWVIFDVEGAEEGELFEVEVRGPTNSTDYTIFHEDNQAMPCTVWFSVEGWDEGTQNLYIYVKDYDNGITGNAQVQICVPPAPPENCIYISNPVEWQRIPCTGTSGAMCVTITAQKYDYDYCGSVTFTEARFQWSPTGSDPWYTIDDVIGSGPWTTCWDNTDLVQDGDTIYFRVIAHDEYYMPDTSYMVKVFVDCEAPGVTMRLEDVYYTCSNETPKVTCEPLIVKAEVLDTMVDIYSVELFVKRHSDPDIWGYWNSVGSLVPAWSDNIWMYDWAQPCCVERAPSAGGGSQVNGGCMWPNDYWDIRLVVTDAAGNIMFDYDGDGHPDDSTFNSAVTFGVAMTVFMDDEAPQPAISMVADPAASIYNVNPSYLLGGSDKAYVQAGHDITSEISVLPSEDTCEVMKVEWFMDVCVVYDSCWRHVGTSTDPNHYPVTFNPLTDGILDPYELEDGWWYGWLKAVLYDSLGNSKEDIIDLFILDITPSQAVIINPLNDSYVHGDVQLSVLALNKYQIAKVCYEYSSDGETWLPINGGYPNACITGTCDSLYNEFDHVWHTMNTVDDGAYYLRAVATDCDNNVDDDPPTIMVTVANELPSVVLEDPRECERECPDSPLDTLGYVGGTVTLYATASSTVPVDRVEFQYKSIFGYPSTYTDIGTDHFVSGGKYSVEWSTGSLDDGRYHLIARVYNAAGRYADSDPITISVDNSGPFAQIVSIMGDPNPDGMNITLGDVIDIELVAIDSTSDDGWTRCYNSGLVGIQVCIESCSGTQYTKCFEVSPVYDGFHTVQWNTSGLEFEGCSGCYKFFVEAWDCLGNVGQSSTATVYVSDVTAPITTIGGFDGSYIYGYSSEKVSTLLFEYADSGATDWIPIGWSSYVGAYCNYLYKTSWDPVALDDGTYQIRVISHDTCSNQDDDMAPVAYFKVLNSIITPYSFEILYDLSFEKNWCTGDMFGIVRQIAEYGTPVVIARYGSSYECVHMQSEIGSPTKFAGSFDATSIASGGRAKFFSSVTVHTGEMELYTGEVPPTVTYLTGASFDVVKVKTDLGTHGTYQDGCVEVTIPDGAVDSDRYIWVAPTMMEWAPVTQPDILPIGDDNGYATHVSFTDCNYCCDWFTTHFGGDQGQAAGAGVANGDCCFNSGKYAKIKMCYDATITVAEEHLAVAWWDCNSGEYRFDNIFYPATVGGFDTENHTVEFATTCLKGPFVVVQVLERHCEGTISVNMLEIEPYCNGYTNTMPTFKALITDNVQGTGAIDQGSIKWKVDLFNPGQLVRIYNGEPSSFCDKWMPGFGSFQGAGYDEVSGIFRAGWNDPDFYHYGNNCDGCYYVYYTGDYYYYCNPMNPLAAGDHMATVTAMNTNIQTCTDTVNFAVDATEPSMWFADSAGAYAGSNPHICIYFTDTEAGVDKSSIWVDIFGDNRSYPDPNDHAYIATMMPDQLNWINDTTVCLDFTFEFQYGYLHLYVYGGPEWKCYNECPTTQYYGYLGGAADCVGNRLDAFWQYYTVDADGPSIDLVGCGDILQLEITDELSGVAAVHVYEDGVLADEAITQDMTNPEYWWYSPATGVQKVDIKAVDNVGNTTTFSFSLPVDCEGPAVEFAGDYVCKNPTIVFWVTDPAGVDWTTVNAYVTGCNEACYYYAPDLTDNVDTETGKVTLEGCNFDCSDGNEIELYVFSGTSYTGDGPCDINDNCGKYRRCSFVVDAYAPSISVGSTDDRPIMITITDAKSGVDWSTLMFYEDGLLICEGLVCTDEGITIDVDAGKIMYEPEEGGLDVEIRINDMTGCNLATKTFETQGGVLILDKPHNYPNPFDPAKDGVTNIDPGLSMSSYLTVKIYDFAGEFVKELQKDQWTGSNTLLYWDGTTDDGTQVANGTYLCYLHARDVNGGTKTAVIKITVLEQDE